MTYTDEEEDKGPGKDCGGGCEKESGEINWQDAVLFALVVALSVFTAAGRFLVPGRTFDQFSWPLTYEAVAHVTFGLLVGLAHGKRWWLCWYVAAALLAVETFCFLFLRP